MNNAPFVTVADHWMDLPTAADYAGVSYCTLVDAVTHREVRATTTHPARPGDWMVPAIDVEWWSEHAVNGLGRDRSAALASRV